MRKLMNKTILLFRDAKWKCGCGFKMGFNFTRCPKCGSTVFQRAGGDNQ